MKNEKYYVTSPIYYASGKLTLGHCFCNVLADTCARFKRLEGYDAIFSTGSDEHGMKVMRSAEKEGLSPKEFVDKTVAEFKELWEMLGIEYSVFIRTTDEKHESTVKKIVQKLYDQGDIYLGKYEGLYCVPCETYFSESQLVDGKCPDCKREVELSHEECYFFRLSKYQKFIEELFNNNENFLVPQSRKNEIFNSFIKPGLQDLCITRTNFDWGIKTPFDEKHVLYVWIDALINYISLLGYSSADESMFKKYWPADVHLIGRDITRFHAVVWPIILYAIGVEPPKQIHSTGFLTQKGDRISKSKSNSFDPVLLINRYGRDAVRYYLLKEGPLYSDMPYTPETFLTTINSDLCNDLGNLVNRTVSMITQYNDKVVNAPNELLDIDKQVVDIFSNLSDKCVAFMNEQKSDAALKEIIAAVRFLNKYIDSTTPWILNKNNDKTRLNTVMYVLFEGIRIASVLLNGFLVDIPSKIFSQLNLREEQTTFDSVQSFSVQNFGASVEKGDLIYSRLDIQKELQFLSGDEANQEKNVELLLNEKVKKTSERKSNDSIVLENALKNKVSENLSVAPVNNKEQDIQEYISIDDFAKIKLEVGKVISCEEVEGSTKLLKSIVETKEKKRTIVSGIAPSYSPAEMVGKLVIVVANLKPAKIRGIVSEGMLLCAEDGEFLSMVTVDRDIKEGSDVC